MDATQYQRVKECFLHACELGAAERIDFLQQLHRDNAETHAEVVALLEQDAQSPVTTLGQVPTVVPAEAVPHAQVINERYMWLALWSLKVSAVALVAVMIWSPWDVRQDTDVVPRPARSAEPSGNADRAVRALPRAVFGPSGLTFATVSSTSRVQIWDTATKRPIRAFPASAGAMEQLTIAADDGTVLCVSAGAPAQLLSVETGEVLTNFGGNVTGERQQVRLSANVRYAVVTAHGKPAQIRDTATEAVRFTVGTDANPASVACFTEDGRFVAVALPGQVAIHSVTDGAEVASFAMSRARVSGLWLREFPGRMVIAHYNGALRVRELAADSFCFESTASMLRVHDYVCDRKVQRIAVTLIDGENACQLAMLDLSEGGREFWRLGRNHAHGWPIGFDASGKKLLTVHQDHVARIWNAATGALIDELRGHTAAIEDAAWSPDGTRILTVAADDTARLWNLSGDAPIVLRLGE